MGSWKFTLKLEIYLIDSQGNMELKEQKMTSPDAFFKHFPVHKNKMKKSIKKNVLIVEESFDENKIKHYVAKITSTRENQKILIDEPLLCLYNAI